MFVTYFYPFRVHSVALGIVSKGRPWKLPCEDYYTTHQKKKGFKNVEAFLEKPSAFPPEEYPLDDSVVYIRKPSNERLGHIKVHVDAKMDDEDLRTMDEVFDGICEFRHVISNIKNEYEYETKSIRKKFKKFLKFIFVFTPLIFVCLFKTVYSLIENYLFITLYKLF
ncbi:hypothetical protein POVWA2_095430 [Plasmodium ovale wallikeri]|uniref:Uncharacterized protein n=1 Tax=Plasmodium ovale wallikeri TaxID=864142 RepID=A0A1A8YJR7_PLAOA|nr:hypothetical protein POVWA1_007840 [Plasmodium ovale wallikeri]SBT59366.1 hypothetical protein POVWA2_095430 [Plasmodium ovale wallikeri]